MEEKSIVIIVVLLLVIAAMAFVLYQGLPQEEGPTDKGIKPAGAGVSELFEEPPKEVAPPALPP